ncbi:hypothetical protein SYNPS1DRAFT_27849 [Syncephalis pseudoplumigaleata]|uniref:Uncharacterized protein n=1 Tax=Syncephalis pseudoplumigaleata TaxID=1712513 RepID=A0A4P9Z3T2_9FUNG|nr:hypothetical protein SYNPS1DRAFT_27849 [Syncephalis pseudoplumigaleata]|eukprot:RKP26461.1 hypothetical protein SYNPS1DRAFT_27849 [Syncephalis pseudoplumigaleata]
MAAENHCERPGASGERAGISPLNTPTAHANTADVAASSAISPPSSAAMAANAPDHRRHSSSSNMSLHGHSPLGRMEVSSFEHDSAESDSQKAAMAQSQKSNSSLLQPPPSMSSASSSSSLQASSGNSSSNSAMIDAGKFTGWNLLVQNPGRAKEPAMATGGTLLSNPPSTNGHFASIRALRRGGRRGGGGGDAIMAAVVVTVVGDKDDSRRDELQTGRPIPTRRRSE